MKRSLLLLLFGLAGTMILSRAPTRADENIASGLAPNAAPQNSDAPAVEQIPTGIEGNHSGPPIKVGPHEELKTIASFTPPIEITIVAKTDFTNLRIGYAARQVIFNWEEVPDELRVDGGPADGEHRALKGRIPSGQYVTIRWVVTNTDQSIYVDGDLRFEFPADYSQINKPIRIFEGAGSIVTVQSLQTRQLK